MGRAASTAPCPLQPWENKARISVQPLRLSPQHGQKRAGARGLHTPPPQPHCWPLHHGILLIQRWNQEPGAAELLFTGPAWSRMSLGQEEAPAPRGLSSGKGAGVPGAGRGAERSGRGWWDSPPYRLLQSPWGHREGKMELQVEHILGLSTRSSTPLGSVSPTAAHRGCPHRKTTRIR